MTTETRDAILVGLFFVAYGLLSWYASGITRNVKDNRPDFIRRLEFARTRRNAMIREEGIDEGINAGS